MTGTQAAFDAAARQYDDAFSRSAIGKMQRLRVWDFLQPYLAKHHIKDVLELNGGTGEDAVWLAQQGCQVTTTDLSEEMMAIAQQKGHRAGVTITTSVCSFENIATQFSGKQFDLIFSNFGGLNCIAPANITQLAHELHALLRPGGMCVWVVMSRDCWWERFYFRQKNNNEAAQRRSIQGAVNTTIDGHTFPIWYYAPDELLQLVETDFEEHTRRAIGWAIPPSFLEPFFKTRKLFLHVLNFWERSLGNRKSLAARGDHFLIAMRRKDR